VNSNRKSSAALAILLSKWDAGATLEWSVGGLQRGQQGEQQGGEECDGVFLRTLFRMLFGGQTDELVTREFAVTVLVKAFEAGFEQIVRFLSG
jgi:hypothetical protein